MIFACPSCKRPLSNNGSEINSYKCENTKCELLNNIFPSINGIPNLIPFKIEECIFQDNKDNSLNYGSKQRRIKYLSKKFRSIYNKFIIGHNKKTISNFEKLGNIAKEDSKVLIIGGGINGFGIKKFLEKLEFKNGSFESIDIYYSKSITAIADANFLPYQNKQFDIVVIQAVLEHVINPIKVVSEIHRVLVENGLVYSETPFMQSVHEGPFDFTRFSHSGHRWLFKDFNEISSGAHQGAFSSVLFILSYAVSGLFRSKYAGIILRMLFSRIFKLLDSITSEKSNIDVACGCYFLGKKEVKNKIKKDENWISDYYKGSQK
mgnify:CR=1 FL=1